MPDQPFTLMAVHAHPDDEAISTGGVLARYSAEGVRTVLVTCTDGRCGDGPGGVKPGEPGHDPEAVVELRTEELAESCRVLGVSHLERLGYRDSGMMGWAQNSEPGSFWTTPVDEAAGRLRGLFEQYRPQVVVTYDPTGFYGHPDHIQTHRVTMAAAAASDVPDKIYFPTISRSRWAARAEQLSTAGVELPALDEDSSLYTSDDADISAWIDVSGFAGQKYDSLAAHASQSDNLFFLKMGRRVFSEIMGEELFVRAQDRSGTPVPEHDLFAGIR